MRRFGILAGIGAVVAICLAGVTNDRDSALPAFQPVQQQGDVSVTLLQVARVTSFSSQFLKDGRDGSVRAIPGVEVMYLVENTGTTPLGTLQVGGVECLSAGAPAKTVAGVVGGGIVMSEPWCADNYRTGFDRPPVKSAKRSSIEREYLRGVVLSLDRVDLQIKTGFGSLQTFTFKNVPIATGGR